MLHVCMVIEKLPMKLWTSKGAVEAIVDRLDSRTHELVDTKLFACWVWCWDTTHIPTCFST